MGGRGRASAAPDAKGGWAEQILRRLSEGRVEQRIAGGARARANMYAWLATCVADNMMKMRLAVMQIVFHMDALKNKYTGALPPNPLRALRLAPLAGRSREEAARNCTEAHFECVAQQAF